MQELLGRLRALDPEASQGLRVIACFDELMSGGVASRGLLSAAAALSGAITGMRRNGTELRIDMLGETVAGAAPAICMRADAGAGATVWIEREPHRALANDAIILERLALAVRVRLDPSSDRLLTRRDLAVAVDDASSALERAEAVVKLGLSSATSCRVLVAPLFAAWRRHADGPEDVVATAFGPVHTAIVPAEAEADGTPLGVGVAVWPSELALSFRTALIALRLFDGTTASPVRADDFGGLAEVLADLSETERDDRDAAGMSLVMVHQWGVTTIDALVRTSSVREAARVAGIHHSTMTTRIDAIETALGFDPLSGLGRTRLGIAFLRWRLRTSHVLELPAPARES